MDDIDAFDHRFAGIPKSKESSGIPSTANDMDELLKCAHTNYAIDAPDGEPDAHFEEELADIQQMMTNNPTTPVDEVINVEEVLKCAHTNYAVDGPDGETDAHWEEDLKDIQDMMNNPTSNTTEEINVDEILKCAHTNYAIDGPDGEPDGHWEEELEDIKHMYDKVPDQPPILKTDPISFVSFQEQDHIHDIVGDAKLDEPEEKIDVQELIKCASTNYAVDAPDGLSDGQLEEEFLLVDEMLDLTEAKSDDQKMMVTGDIDDFDHRTTTTQRKDNL